MKKVFIQLAVIVTMFFIGCNKPGKETDATGRLLSVYLTDSPAELEAVNIDIHSVEVKIDPNDAGDEQYIMQQDKNNSNDSLGAMGGTLWHGGIPVGDNDQFGKWIAVDFKPGVYDILQLRNGIDMLLGSAKAPGTVRKVRIALGSNNHVVKNGEPLSLTLQDDSTNHHIYIDILKESRITNNDGSIAVFLDFDLGRSIKRVGEQYVLFPYLRALPADRSLEIEGFAFPAAASVIVSVYNDTDTTNALPDNRGYFKIRGLLPGGYHISYSAGDMYRDTTTVFDITQNKITLPPMTLVENN